YGVGPIVAETVLGYVRDIRRFPTRDRFASYNGTAPIEVSSGDRVIYRLFRRGNRQLNHAIHIAAVSQISHHSSPGYAYYQRKRGEGMGCTKDLGQGLSTERICSCQSDAGGSARSSRLRPCSWCSRPVSRSRRLPGIWVSMTGRWAIG